MTSAAAAAPLSAADLLLPCFCRAPALLLLYYSLYLAALSTPSWLLPCSLPASALLLSCICSTLFLCASLCSLLQHLCISPDPASSCSLQLLFCSFPAPALPLPCYSLYLAAPACSVATFDPLLMRTFSFPAPVPCCTSLHLLFPPCTSLLPASSFPCVLLPTPNFCSFSDPVLSLFLTCSFLCPALLLPYSLPALSLLFLCCFPALSLLLSCS